MTAPTQDQLISLFESEVRKHHPLGAPKNDSYYDAWVELDEIKGPTKDKANVKFEFKYEYIIETVAGSSYGYYHVHPGTLELTLDTKGVIVGQPKFSEKEMYTRMYEDEVNPIKIVK